MISTLLSDWLRGRLECVPQLDLNGWSNTHRVLDSRASSEPGRYSTRRTPYIEKIQECLSVSSPVTTVVWRKCGQIGGTEAGNNLIGSIIDQHPGPCMMIMATETTAKENSRIRIDSMVRASPRLRAKVASKNSKTESNNIFQKDFPGGYLVITTAGSAAALSSKPVRFVILDEVSKYPEEASNEGDPVSLAIVRTFTFRGREKIYILSTPAVKGQCRVTAALEDCEVIYNFFVPCPHCGHYQVLNFRTGLRLDHDEKDNWLFETTHYVCESCQARIGEEHKVDMLEAGEWRAVRGADVERPRSVGFDKLNTLYAPPGLGPSWSDVMREFYHARKTPARLKTFVNGWLAEVWEDKGEAPDYEKLFRSRRENYHRGTVPEGGLLLTAAADVQENRIEVLVEAWGRGRHCWFVDHHVFPGDTGTPEPWQRLTEFLYRPILHVSGKEMYIQKLGLDTGYRTNGTIGAYNWAREMGDIVYPFKGRNPGTDQYADSDRPVSAPSKVDVHLDGGRTLYGGVLLYSIGVSMLKDEIYAQLRKEMPAYDEPFPDPWRHYPLDVNLEFFRQLTAESKVTKKTRTGGVRAQVWEKHYERNEILDLSVMSRAVAYLLCVDLFVEEDWAMLEADLLNREKRDPRKKVQWMVSDGVEV